MKGAKKFPPTIYFNDRIASRGSIRFTVFHEIKHYVFEDTDDEKDDLADYFARQFMCPTPYLLLKGISSPNEIVSLCGMSMEAACNAYSRIVNRRKKLANKLFEYEIPLIKHLEPVLLEINGYETDAGNHRGLFIP